STPTGGIPPAAMNVASSANGIANTVWWILMSSANAEIRTSADFRLPISAWAFPSGRDSSVAIRVMSDIPAFQSAIANWQLEIIGNPVRHLGQRVAATRDDHHAIMQERPAGQLAADVVVVVVNHRVLLAAREGGGVDGFHAQFIVQQPPAERRDDQVHVHTRG